MTHVISLLVENHQGVLVRIAGLFSGRAYNLESLTVGVTNDPAVSRVTLVCTGDDAVIEQIKKQLNKLIDVIKVIDFIDQAIFERELLLIRVDASRSNRRDILDLCDVFGARIMGVAEKSVTIELAGTTASIDDFIVIVKPYGIKEIVRSGAVAIAQGKN